MRAADLVALGVVLLLVGCGSDDQEPRTLTGERVGRIVEAQLEAEHPAMSPGVLTCQDLVFEIGATTRCTRTAKLSGGRTVRVNGTVRVDSISAGGRLHVKLDDKAVAFGVDKDHLAAEVGRRLGMPAGAVTCTDLDGVVGASVVCETDEGRVEVVVVSVDPARYDVDYRVGPLVG